MDRTLQSIVRSMPQPYGGYLKVAQFQTTDLTRGHPKSIDVLTLPEPTVLYTLFIRYLQLKDGYSADVAFSNAFKGIRSDVRSRLTKLVNSVQEVTTSSLSLQDSAFQTVIRNNYHESGIHPSCTFIHPVKYT